MKIISELSRDIENKKAKIGVIGMGYVGLPLAIRFSQEGYKVVGLDIDSSKINLLNNGKSYIRHIIEEDISLMLKNDFFATNDFAQISNLDVIIICVPTPLGKDNEPDLSYIFGTLDNIRPYLKENQLLILESTTYPGTTEEEIVPFLKSINNKNFDIGINFFVGYSPEREDPGNKKYSTKTIPKIVSGHTKNCLELTTILYNNIVVKTVPVSSTKVAEMTKIMENIHRAVNIGLVNELKIVADKMDIDIFEVINAAATKPFGFTPYFPGPGLGGHCIPIDPFYLTWRAKQFGVDTRFIELAGEINTNMPRLVVGKALEALSSQGKSFQDAKILILGVAYKKNVDDTRESPAFKIIELLQSSNAQVSFSDPFVPNLKPTRSYNFKMKSINIDSENLAKNDVVILVTDHDDFDYELILKHSKYVIDTRGRYPRGEKIIRG